jgi:hypothetical protein
VVSDTDELSLMIHSTAALLIPCTIHCTGAMILSTAALLNPCTIHCTGAVWGSLVQDWMIRCTIHCADVVILSTGIVWPILSTGILFIMGALVCTVIPFTLILCTGEALWMRIGVCLLELEEFGAAVSMRLALGPMTILPWVGGLPIWMAHW